MNNSLNFSVIEKAKILTINKFFSYIYLYPYMFAHKPLCEKFKNDVIKFGNVYVCKSCFCLYCGFLAAILLFFVCKINYFYLLFATFFVALLQVPVFYKNYSRITRSLARFMSGFLALTLLIYSFSNNIFQGSAILLLFILLKRIYNRERAKVDVCKNCPESLMQKSCPGYQKQTEALLKLEEITSNYIMKLRGNFYD